MEVGTSEVNRAGAAYRSVAGLAAMIGIGVVFVPLQLGLRAFSLAHPETSAMPFALSLAGGALVAFAIGYAPMIRRMRAAEREISPRGALGRMIPAFMVAGALVAAVLLPMTALILDSARDAGAAMLARP